MSEQTKQVELREPVKWFAKQMESRLQQNDYKGGWVNCSEEWLCQQAGRKLNKIMFSDTKDLIKLAADVANFAMMIADNARHMVEESESSE